MAGRNKSHARKFDFCDGESTKRGRIPTPRPWADTQENLRGSEHQKSDCLRMCVSWNRKCTADNGLQSQHCEEKVAMRRKCIVLFLLFISCTARQRISAQTVSDLSMDSRSSDDSSSARASGAAGADDFPDWLFPVTKLNQSLPRWFHLGGEYRSRLERPTGIGFASTNDFYLLDRLRVNLGIQPKDWLLFYGEVQDARIFFNHHIANANPYEDKWTLWQAYTQVGSSETGWVDVLGGRDVLRFGDERVIGPSEWLNVGRTFNVARVDLHHPGFKVSVFASSVVPGENTDLHNALPDNNMY